MRLTLSLSMRVPNTLYMLEPVKVYQTSNSIIAVFEMLKKCGVQSTSTPTTISAVVTVDVPDAASTLPVNYYVKGFSSDRDASWLTEQTHFNFIDGNRSLAVPANAVCLHGAPQFNPDAPAFMYSSPLSQPAQFFNPDAPPIMNDRPDYTIRVCIASKRIFNLNEIDSRINHDKPWGERDWAPSAPVATSCEIPERFKERILEALRSHPDVIFAKGPLEMLDHEVQLRRQQEPSAALRY